MDERNAVLEEAALACYKFRDEILAEAEQAHDEDKLDLLRRSRDAGVCYLDSS